MSTKRSPLVLPRAVAKGLSRHLPGDDESWWVEFLSGDGPNVDQTYRFKICANDVVGQMRWGIIYRLVIQDEVGGCWVMTYEKAATENQDDDAFWSKSEYTFHPARARERMITIYEEE